MQELIEAASTLQPAFAATVEHSDLPSAESLVDQDVRAAPLPERPATPATCRAPRAAAVPAAAAGLPRSTMIAASIAAVLAGLLGFAVLKWTQASGRTAVLEAEGAKVLAAAKGLEASTQAYERLMYNDR